MDPQDAMRRGATAVKELVQTTLTLLFHQGDSPANAKACCETLCTLAASEDYATIIHREGGIKCLLTISRQHTDRAKVLVPACTCLSLIAKHDKNGAILAKMDGGLTVLLSILRYYQNTKPFPVYPLFKVLAHYAKHEASWSTFIREGTVKHIANVVNNNEGSTQVHLLCVKVLVNLKSGKNLMGLMECNGPAVLVAAALKNLKSSELALSTLTVLQKLLSVDDNPPSSIEMLAYQVRLLLTQTSKLEVVQKAYAILWGIPAIRCKCFTEFPNVHRTHEYYVPDPDDEDRNRKDREMESWIYDLTGNCGKQGGQLLDSPSLYEVEWDWDPQDIIRLPEAPNTPEGGSAVDALCPLVRDRDIQAECVVHDAYRFISSQVKNYIVYDCLQPDLEKRPTEPDGSPSCLVFSSAFESGNLRRAAMVYDNEYDLVLSGDVNTSGSHIQWFYFSIRNVKPGVPYKFNILNMEKPTSLFSVGMRPLMCCVPGSSNKGGDYMEWTRVGDKISYYQNLYTKSKNGKKIPCYTLTFTIEFLDPYGTYYLAYGHPYTHSQCKRDINVFEAKSQGRNIMRRWRLCKTLGLRDCELVVISNFNATNEEILQRKCIFLTARVHPGEATASWMMKGILDFLTGSGAAAICLRDRCIFYIIPMLNPDGVALGNNRCALAGVDLNRQWQSPSQYDHPTIYYAKKLISRLLEIQEVAMFCDFHGHSRKKNVFMYGCHNDHCFDKRLKEKVFPLMLSRKNSNFSFPDSDFKVQRSKLSTARVVLSRELNIIQSYTVEASLCGPRQEDVHFNADDMIEMGRSFCMTLLEYTNHLDPAYIDAWQELEIMYPSACKDTPSGSHENSDLDEESRPGSPGTEDIDDRSRGGNGYSASTRAVAAVHVVRAVNKVKKKSASRRKRR